MNELRQPAPRSPWAPPPAREAPGPVGASPGSRPGAPRRLPCAKRWACVALLLAAGCLPIEIREDMETAQRNVAELQLKLKQAETAATPDLPQVRADLQVAETRLHAVQAEAVQARVKAGFDYAETAVKLVPSAWLGFLPGGAAALSGLLGLLQLARGFIEKKPEVKK